MDGNQYDDDDPKRHLKRIQKIVGVSGRIQNLVLRRRSSVKEETTEEREERILASSVEDRANRAKQIQINEKYLLELISYMLGVDENEIVECAFDNDDYVNLLRSFSEVNGVKGVIAQYQLDDPPALGSGRYNPKYKLKGEKINMAIFSSGERSKILKETKAVGVYRTSNLNRIQSTSLENDVNFLTIPRNREANIVITIHDFLKLVMLPILRAKKNFGNCSRAQREEFIYGISTFVRFLNHTEKDLDVCKVQFFVDNALFKGHFLVQHQIEASSKKRDKVTAVEKAVLGWFKQMHELIFEGKFVRKEVPDDGPLQEFEHWRRMLAKFTNVLEFVEDRPFLNYLQCLDISRSKIVRQWPPIKKEIHAILTEAKDNVRYMTALEKFWEPLYHCKPSEISQEIGALLAAVINVFQSSKFYSTPDKISSFLSKVSNQVIVASKRHLTDDGHISIWAETMTNLNRKIYECKAMQDAFREAYDEIVGDLCSRNFLFTRIEKFEIRLTKIREIMDVFNRYKVLRRMPILQAHTDKIESLFEQLSNKPYDPLDYHVAQFNDDFIQFRKDIGVFDLELQEFAKVFLETYERPETRIMHLKRFESLQLVSFNLLARYDDIADMIYELMQEMKDKYNEERENPPLGRIVAPACGRIQWVRTLLYKFEDPLKYLLRYECIHHTKRFETTVQYYNFITSIFSSFEGTVHKIWYTYIEQVRDYLNVPILIKHPETNRYKINLSPYVQQAIKEIEGMWKLGLEVPHTTSMLALCKDRVNDTYNQLKEIVRRNDKLRHSIYPIFLPFMRIHLAKLEKVFVPALSLITWLSFDIHEYFEEVKSVLWPIEGFVKDISDANDFQIESQLKVIEDQILVKLPKNAVTLQEFIDMNNEHRQEVEKIIEARSLTAEKATVDLILKFIDKAECVSFRDDSGKFQVSKITNENRRTEENKPISKYDWLQFDKIYKAVGYPSEEDNIKLCYREYKDLTYDVTLLHIDCVELFAYYNHRQVAVLAKCTKRSMELLKARSNLSNFVRTYDCDDEDCPTPLLKASISLKIPKFSIRPSLSIIQKAYDVVLLNIIETHYGVTTWGKQAKDKARTLKVRPVLAEVRHERNMFKMMMEHKDVSRYKISFDDGVVQLEPEVKKWLLKRNEIHNYLWSKRRDEEIQEFVDVIPITCNIRDRLIVYEKITDSLRELPKYVCMGLIKADCTEMIESLVEESKEWKRILGRKLCDFYRVIINEIVEFIDHINNGLHRKLDDLNDCRRAMACLKEIREGFYHIEISMTLIEHTYDLFREFEIEAPPEDEERVDGLRIDFNTLLQLSSKVTHRIMSIQGSLQEELENGVKKLQIDVQQFDEDFVSKGPMVEGIPAKEASDRVLLFDSRIQDLQRSYETYSEGEKLFGMPVNEYPALEKRRRDINFLNRLYKLYLEVMKTVDGYFQLNFHDVNMDAINAEIQDFVTRCKALPRGMKNWPAYVDLKKKIDDFSEICPLMELMATNAMKERHWRMLEDRMKYKFDTYDENFTLGYVMKGPLNEFREDIEEICVGAAKEQDIEVKLQGVVRDWKDIEMPLATFKSRGEILIKASDVLDIISKLEDSLMVMSSLASNRFNGPFKKDIMMWLHKLTDTSNILEKWLLVQSLWMYLEAVFVGGDISRQLPTEAKRFSNIDKAWIRIMYRTRDIPNVVEVCTGDEVVASNLTYLIEQLELCQKSLTVYLESKRLIFPRFFFISDPVLLEILGQASNPETIQPHLLSIFDGVARVEFDAKKGDTIMSMMSDNGEKIPLISPVRCVGLVEIWIGKLLESVLETVRNIMSALGQQISDTKFNHDIYQSQLDNLCGQAQLICIQLVWTAFAEFALNNCRTDRRIMARTNLDFQEMLNFLVDQTVKNLTKLERISAETLVTIHVHQRDIFDELVKMKIKTPTDFEWQKQARFYYDANQEEVLVKITDINFIYQNEYLGVTERLAITPLTDRCYITLAQAVGMFMGGAPAGPAGTGKTETTKDMGRALGKLVVVFNCSDQMDFRGLGRIFKGLAQSGSWGCFDEFNRIELPVLSVAAQQIYIVLNAKREKMSSFIFSDGDNVTLNSEFGIFITMNPGYAGRQELPENLKIQFRTVAMMVPDRQIIMRVKLASCGFRDNVKLAAKFYTLYKLCEEQLSKQVHYDFGLRNILSVLRTLGAAKRAVVGKVTEDEIVMQVLRDMNLSKLVDEDEPLFLSLISDLFPGMKLQASARGDLQEAIHEAVTYLKLINHPAWNLKIVQLYETSLVRHGLMVLGPTGAGKTKCMNTLLKSLTYQELPHSELRMNPKSITAPQMFGRLDVTTNDWTDGIFSVLWRRTLKFKPNEYVWLVLDGPVDAVWIENLNSVLDDNKTLTLANGDRIVMSANCKLVFEPDAIDNASPATVSRMGMVFMSSSVMPWNAILEGWLLPKAEGQKFMIRGLFDSLYDDLHIFVQTKLLPKMKLLEAVYIRQTCDIFNGFFEPNQVYSQAQLEKYFLFAIMWSLGAVLELDDRDKFEEFVKNHPSKMGWPKTAPGESIFEFLVTDEGDWVHWSTKIEEYIYPCDKVPEYASILVPNVDNVRTAFLIETIAKQNKSVLLIGEQGTAKTVMIKSFMINTYNPEVHLSKSFNFSSATTPVMFQRTIESYVEKRVGLTFGPPQNRKMTIFIDDINMPVVNEWGDQITNEIVRQLMECKGFYSLERPGDFETIQDIQFIAAMIHAGGGRNDIPARLKRQFNVFNCTLPSTKSMDKIFGVIGTGYFCLARFNEVIVEFVEKLIPLTRSLWQETKTKMLPTPAKFHYIFNLRDLSRIWGGMLRIESEQCSTVSEALRLWSHECTRVLADRFINTEDREWFKAKMHAVVREEIGDYYDEFPQEDVYFVDFLRDEPEAEINMEEQADIEAEEEDYFIYEEIPSFDVVKERIYMFINRFNVEVRGYNLDIVLFQDALIHLMIISRILRTSRGNALLVGVGGSGKQSLTRLASFIADYKFHQITLTRAYNLQNFADEFKYLYRVAGLHGNGISFIFTDNDIKEESFLEYLNNVLSSGEIANLYLKDEIDEIMNELIPIMKKKDPKRVPTQENLYDFFIQRARNNLHVVLCFSPVGEKFRNRALKFPGLISGCMIDWFQKWPMDALIAVSTHLMNETEIKCSERVKDSMIYMMAFVHDNVSDTCTEYFERFRRQTHVTPKSFLSFLTGYKIIYDDRIKTIIEQSKKMTNGLGKLAEAAESVDILKKEMEIKRVEIAAAELSAKDVIDNVQESRIQAAAARDEVEEKKGIQEVLVDKIKAARSVTEEELEKTMPQLLAAAEALNTVKTQDIAVVRRLGVPPYLLTVILDCVLILSRKKLQRPKYDPERKFVKPSWAQSTKMMANTSFLRKVRELKKDLIDAEVIDLLGPYFRLKNYNIQSASVACSQVVGLLKWTKAMADFYKVNVNVLPLRADLIKKEKLLNKAKSQLQKLEDAKAMADTKLAEAESEFKIANDALQAVKDEAALLQSKLDAAHALITGLSEERVRWTEQIETFKTEITKLVGDVLILIGFLSYAGPFNQIFRALLQKNWQEQLIFREIPFTESINVVERLTDTATIGEWNLQGLPNDELSIQNGIIVTQASRYPLLIDPQSQGKSWVKQKEKENNLITTTLSHKFFRNHLEDAIQLGRPMLVEDVGEELDPCLDNVLEKNYVKMGGSLKVKVGDKEIDVHEDFRMFITTKLPNPNYRPEVAARTSVIDFTVTMRGLEDQLLGRVILSEKHEIEAQRVQLDMDVTANKKLSKELEANLLYKLSTTEGSLLDDLSLMEVLNTSKSKAIEIKEKLETSEETKKSINQAREEFRPVAARGSVLYFLIVKMSLVNNMYQTSLVQFLERFDYSLKNADKSTMAFRRINAIIDFLTYDIFKYKSRGLYEAHKFLFVLLMTLDIDLQRGKITFDEFQTFIKGGAALDINTCPPKPYKWITDSTWLNLVQLSFLKEFTDILDSIKVNDRMWKEWYESDEPEETFIPDGYNLQEVFGKLLIIRSFCLDRTLSQSRQYIASSLGPKFAEPVVLNYEDMLEESRPLTPIICFLSMGSDPTPSIQSLAKKNMVKVTAISMGQGQEVHARKLMENSLVEGSWVLLQNCHLGLDYMNELTMQIMELERVGEGYHELFRLWITTEVHPDFPITMLQMSIKFTNEPPSGIRAGLKRTYNSMNLDLFDFSDSPLYQPLIYTTSFLHTIVQERRKFGALGWNIPYEFNSSDWYASCLFMQKHLEDSDGDISWKTVNYMIGEVQYGGRVTDDYDKRLLNCLSRTYFGPEMFEEGFEFYEGYEIVVRRQIEDIVDYFDVSMPAIDPPYVYGLHANADITYQTNKTLDILDTIISVQPKESAISGGETREAAVTRLVKEMLSRLPPPYDEFEVKQELTKQITPMNIFLRQEIDRIQKIILLVKATLNDLLLAIEGTIIMSESLRDAFDNIYDARVPQIWKRGSWLSSTLGFWFSELIERNNQFYTWCFEGRPMAFWMTGFFNPQGFLTAMRQETARANVGWALDKVILQNEVMKFTLADCKEAARSGVYVHGLFLDGAGWSRREIKLVEATNKVLYTLMPIVRIYASNVFEAKGTNYYECPVYKKANRTDLNFIVALNLNTSENPDHWILRGVALLCDTK